MMRVATICLGALAFAATANADTYIKTKIESSGFAGIGGMKGETEVWISGSRSVEKTKFDVKSPLLKLFMGGQRTHSITDLEKNTHVALEKKQKQYREVSFDDIKGELETAKQTVKDGYEQAKSDAPHRPPWTKDGMKDTRVEVATSTEEKKFAGIPTRRSTMKMFTDAVDESTGETVTFKVTYDAWMATEVPGQEELAAYRNGYADAVGVSFDTEDVSLASALSSAGIELDGFDEKSSGFKGFPMKVTIRVGSVLTASQKKELAEMKAEGAKKKKGGFGGIKVDLGGGVGGLTDQLKDKAQEAVTDELTTQLTDKLAQSLFGLGAVSDEDGDLVFFTTTSEVKKIEQKPIKPETFEIPDEYEAVP